MLERDDNLFEQQNFMQNDNFSHSLYSKTTYNSSKKELLKSFSSRLYCWGYVINNPGQQQTENLEDSLVEKGSLSLEKSKQGLNSSLGWDFLDYQGSPRRIKKFREMAIVSVTCGKNHSGLISNNGSLYMIGSNDFGQLGTGSDSLYQNYTQPILVHSLVSRSVQVDQVACGHSHTMMISKSGQVYSWGYGKFGALGSGHFENRVEPLEIPFFMNQFNCSSKIKMIDCGAHHSALINAKGQLFLWGAGEVGQLGIGNRINEPSPILVDHFLEGGESVDMIACGYFHTVVLTTRGRMLQTGQSREANGDISICSTFAEIPNIPRDYITNVKAKEYSVALNSLGQLLIWSSTSNLQVVTHKEQVNDFDLCKAFVLFRCKDKFFKWNLKQKTFELIKFEDGVIQEFSILSCGHNYILGVKTKKRVRQQKSSGGRGSKHLKSAKELGKGELSGRKEGKFSESKALLSSRRNSGRQSTQVHRISSGNRSKNSSQDLNQFFRNRKSQYNQNTSQNTYKSLMTNERLKIQRIGTQKKIHEHIEYEESLNDMGSQHKLRLYNSSKKQLSSRKNTSNAENRRTNSIQLDKQKESSRNCGSAKKVLEERSTNQTPSKPPNDAANFYLAPNSLRISYDENFNAGALHKNHSSAQVFPQSHTKIYEAQGAFCGKEEFKDALKVEMEKRIQIEKQLEQLKTHFESFKKDVGVEQTKMVLAESQSEYQKLYDICVVECEKGAKMSDQFKKEKKLREERENQILQLNDENQMLTNQVQYLEEQLSQERESSKSIKTQLERIKGTIKQQERVIDQLKEKFHEEKASIVEKNFDLEESLAQCQEELQEAQQRAKDFCEQLEREREENKKVFTQNMEIQSQISCLDQQVAELEKEKNEQLMEIDQITKNTQEYQKMKQQEIADLQKRLEDQSKELDLSRKENSHLQEKVQSKIRSLEDCNSMITSLKSNEQELKEFIQRLQSQLKTFSSEKHSSGNGEMQSEVFVYQSHQVPQILESEVSTQQREEEESSQDSKVGQGVSYSTKQVPPTRKLNNSTEYSSRNLNGISTVNQKSKSIAESKPNKIQSLYRQQVLAQNSFQSQQQPKQAKKSSPEKLQSAMKTSEVSTKKFISDIKQLMGSVQASTFSSTQQTQQQQQKKPSRNFVQENKKPAGQSRSSSPLDKTPPRPKSVSTNASSNRNMATSILSQKQSSVNSRQAHQSISEKNCQSSSQPPQCYQDISDFNYEDQKGTTLISIDHHLQKPPIEEPQIISNPVVENLFFCHSQNPSFGSSLNFSQRIQPQIETNQNQGIFDDTYTVSSASQSSANLQRQLTFAKNTNELEGQMKMIQQNQEEGESQYQKNVSLIDISQEDSYLEDSSKPCDDRSKQQMSFGDYSSMNFLWSKQPNDNPQKPEEQEEEENDTSHSIVVDSFQSAELPLVTPGQNIDDLRVKLDLIRKNKSLLEGKIKEYEQKLSK